MHLSSQRLIVQAIASIRHGVGRRLNFETAHRRNRLASPHREGRDFPLQGFAVTVWSAAGIAIEDTVGCDAQVLVGQAWDHRRRRTAGHHCRHRCHGAA